LADLEIEYVTVLRLTAPAIAKIAIATRRRTEAALCEKHRRDSRRQSTVVGTIGINSGLSLYCAASEAEDALDRAV
jgi:hypothetical protein